MQTTSPKLIERPLFARWMWDRGLELRPVAEALGCSAEQVRLISLPFEDAKRRVPGADLMERIFKFTEGAVTPADFYPEHIRRPANPVHAVEASAEAAPWRRP